MIREPPPFFHRGPSPLARLTFFTLAAIAIMIADHRFRALETVRLSLTGALLEPYWWAARARGADAPWRRVLGVEAGYSTGAIPFARAPGARVVGGIAYSVDAPLRREWRAYLSAVVRP